MRADLRRDADEIWSWIARPRDTSRPSRAAYSRACSSRWLPEYTTELLKVLRVLTRLVTLEPWQGDLLGRIVGGSTLDADALRASGALIDTSADTASAPDDADA